MLNFLKILCEKGTLRELSGCARAYRVRYNQAHGILEATATTASAHDGAQAEPAREAGKLTGKTIDLKTKVDPEVLGGIRLDIEGTELDGTVQNRLPPCAGILRRSLCNFPCPLHTGQSKRISTRNDFYELSGEQTKMQLKPEEISKIIRAQIKHYENAIEQSETGTVIMVGDGIARASGLEKCMAGELLQFDNGEYGMAQNLEENTVSIVLLGSDVGIKEGSTVKRTGKVVSVPVGDA